MSRIQNSSSGASTQLDVAPSIRRARSRSVGSTTIVTGSNSATAWATAVQAA